MFWSCFIYTVAVSMNCLRYLYIECFHSCGQHLCKFIETKESLSIRKEFNSQRILSGHQQWPPFHCFGTPIWLPWRHVKTLYGHVSILIHIIVPAFFILYYYFWSLNNHPLNPHTNPYNISVIKLRNIDSHSWAWSTCGDQSIFKIYNQCSS